MVPQRARHAVPPAPTKAITHHRTHPASQPQQGIAGARLIQQQVHKASRWTSRQACIRIAGWQRRHLLTLAAECVRRALPPQTAPHLGSAKWTAPGTVPAALEKGMKREGKQVWGEQSGDTGGGQIGAHVVEKSVCPCRQKGACGKSMPPHSCSPSPWPCASCLEYEASACRVEH